MEAFIFDCDLEIVKHPLLSARDTVLAYVDSTPSELFMKDLSGKTIFTMVIIPPFKRENLQSLGQFKNSRSKRRGRKIDALIKDIKEEKIEFIASATVVDKITALQSAKNFLRNNKILTLEIPNLNHELNLFGHTMSYGKLLCLTWYSICLYTRSSPILHIAGIAQKQAAAIIDLLPGDNSQYTRNLHLITAIADNSELRSSNLQEMKKLKVSNFGIVYGTGIQGTNFEPMKQTYELCLTDWISHSLYEKFSIGGDAEVAKLANYLLEKGNLKIQKDFLIW